MANNAKYVRVISGNNIKLGTVGIVVLYDKVKPVNNLMIDFRILGRIILNKRCLEFITKKEYFFGALSG